MDLIKKNRVDIGIDLDVVEKRSIPNTGKLKGGVLVTALEKIQRPIN
jgi:hypothetical protein